MVEQRFSRESRDFDFKKCQFRTQEETSQTSAQLQMLRSTEMKVDFREPNVRRIFSSQLSWVAEDSGPFVGFLTEEMYFDEVRFGIEDPILVFVFQNACL